MKHNPIHLVLLAGGYGTRLSPLSQKILPKQFIKLLGNRSPFQNTLLHNSFETFIVSNTEYRTIIQQQALEINAKNCFLILEKEKLNTALSIAIAASCAQPNDVLLISPADLYIENLLMYHKAVAEAIKLTINTNVITSIVTQAQNAHAMYGYLRLKSSTDGHNAVHEFIEKPMYLTDYKDYYWNTGVFACVAKNYLSLLETHAPDILHECKELLHNTHHDEQGVLCLPSTNLNTDSLSVDQVIMEKATNNLAIIGDFDWLDMGNWHSLYRLTQHHKKIIVYDNISHDKGVFMQKVIKDKLILIIANNKAFLLCDHVLADTSNHERKSWGSHSVLYRSDGLIIKHLIVNIEQHTSLQKHQHRSENWLILSGTANIITKDKPQHGKCGDIFFIPIMHPHRIENSNQKEKLHILELQIGDILSEEDIIRL